MRFKYQCYKYVSNPGIWCRVTGRIDSDISKRHVLVELPESEEEGTKLFRNVWSCTTNVTVTSHKRRNYGNTTTRTSDLRKVKSNFQFIYLPVCSSENKVQMFLLQY